MKISISTAHMARLAPITVEHLEVDSFVVIKSANAAVIFGEIHFAIHAGFSLGLNSTTANAFYILDVISIKFVRLGRVSAIFQHLVIVAAPALKKLALAAAFVVRAFKQGSML